jgi:hypothetical protein
MSPCGQPHHTHSHMGRKNSPPRQVVARTEEPRGKESPRLWNLMVPPPTSCLLPRRCYLPQTGMYVCMYACKNKCLCMYLCMYVCTYVNEMFCSPFSVASTSYSKTTSPVKESHGRGNFNSAVNNAMSPTRKKNMGMYICMYIFLCIYYVCI